MAKNALCVCPNYTLHGLTLERGHAACSEVSCMPQRERPVTMLRVPS